MTRDDLLVAIGVFLAVVGFYTWVAYHQAAAWCETTVNDLQRLIRKEVKR